MTLTTALNHHDGEPEGAILIAPPIERTPEMGEADAEAPVCTAHEVANWTAADGTRECVLRECLDEAVAIFRLTAVRMADAGEMVRRCERRLGGTDAREFVAQAYLVSAVAIIEAMSCGVTGHNERNRPIGPPVSLDRRYSLPGDDGRLLQSALRGILRSM
jgi:hypothetical protein